ncbi:MAG: glutamate--tRNA ligase [Methylophilaceae bacterium]|nr:glutamate--tRNA ligase [Methylophilaceae bacterium]
MTVITRFAPSPTGDLHIGGARTALFAWAYARNQKGKFILRIEDTDLDRSTPEAIEVIINGMNWLGLHHDGPIHYQTDRMDRYKAVTQSLLENNQAYPCYSSKEELDALRESQMKEGLKPKYDGRWRPELGKKLPEKPLDIHPVIRFRNPSNGHVSWNDRVKGDITFNNEELDDFIISRSDGTPTYNFCVVVDDWDMNITDVIRGDDHVNNTPRQINLFKALNAPVPNYAHLSMILGSDGQKLSKRHGSVSVLEYQKKGYLPQAIKNYLARLGWSHGDDEIFSMVQFSQWFDLGNITSSPAQFNDEKLNWLNNQYIREMDDESIFNLMIDFFKFNDIDELSKQKLIKGIALYKERVNNLVELSNQILFIVEQPHIMPELIQKYLDADRLNLVKGLNSLLDEVKWEDDEINSLIKKFVAANQLKFPLIAMPLRVILTGSDHTPSIASIMSIIGREETKQRILKYIN